jgi:hypothetical protein
MPYLTALEKAVIEAILRGAPSSEECFRFQLHNSCLDIRKFNGYGFFTNFSFPMTCLPVRPQTRSCLQAQWSVNNFADSLSG